ncbi:arsenate reductase ArsC [Aliarcobacter butzleri]|uniref:arsenate reductase ArsC n=1 Tax=Aliarcobacter butzleri TaxID=28197 RepID=UPI00344B13EB
MSKKVLFVCVHNSARSQIAEALLKKYGGNLFQVESAGFEPSSINPLVIEILQREENIDISNNTSDAVFDLFKQGKHFNFVIAVCDEANAQRCPIFSGLNYKIHWSFPDPSLVRGSEIEKYHKVKDIYLSIKEEVFKFIELVKEEKLRDNFPSNWKVG